MLNAKLKYKMKTIELTLAYQLIVIKQILSDYTRKKNKQIITDLNAANWINRKTMAKLKKNEIKSVSQCNSMQQNTKKNKSLEAVIVWNENKINLF